jgi:glutamate-1-semialdehyde aminotransferase
MRKNKGQELYRRAKKMIPGGTQLLSKRPEMFLPGGWPAYYRKCKGIDVWDLENRHYQDFTIAGVGACPLGYADKDVDQAVKAAIAAGNMCTLNAPEEIELAELLCKIHPWAGMVRYARGGGEAMAIAVRIARAYSGKSKILFCGYHGWHDWYLAANLGDSTALDGQLLPGLDPAGVPRELRGTAIPFSYNDLAEFKKLVARHAGSIAAVVMEPVRSVWPQKEFLAGIREITATKKIPLIFDEVTSGFRMAPGGIHRILGIDPDLCVFAKAMGNGYPMAAVIGRVGIMNSAQKSFISSTYWTDRIGPTAALATIRKFTRLQVHKHLIRTGALIQSGWKALAAKHHLTIHVSGIFPLSHWQIMAADSQLVHTAVNSLMLDEGYLVSKAFYATLAHKDKEVKQYLSALDRVLGYLRPFIGNNTVGKIFKGLPAHNGFKRLT